MNPTLKKTLLALLALTVLGGGILAYRSNAAKSPEQRYRFQTLEKGDLTQTVSANGTLNPVVLVNVGTQVSGTVVKLYVDFNDKVEKGQPLLELDPSLLRAQAAQSAASVENIRATLDLARANEARMKALLAQEYVSQQEYDQALQARKSAEAGLTQARAAALKDRVNLGYAVIRSPVSGTVVDRVVDLGQTVAASLQTPVLFKIAQDMSKMCIDSSFAEADIGNIHAGQKANFTVDAFPSRNFEGEVQEIRLNPTTQQNVVTYNVRIALSNPENILLPGMTAYVGIGVASRKNVLLLPNAALRFKPTEASSPDGKTPGNGASKSAGRKRDAMSGIVYLIREGKLQPVNVQFGITDNRNTEVIGGELKPGDRIIVGENVPLDSAKPSSVGMRMF